MKKEKGDWSLETVHRDSIYELEKSKCKENKVLGFNVSFSLSLFCVSCLLIHCFIERSREREDVSAQREVRGEMWENGMGKARK